MSEIAIVREQALAELDEAKRLIARAIAENDHVLLKEIRAQGAAYELHRTRIGSKEAANDAGEIKVRAERGLAILDVAAAPHGGGRKSSCAPPQLDPPLEDFAPHTRATIRKLAPLKDREFDARIAAARADEIAGISTSRVLKTQDTSATLGSSESDEWYTPAEYIEAARKVLGGIDLDPASCPEANTVVKAKRFYSADDDGLAQEWHGRVFMNPPFGRDGSPAFVSKLLAEHAAGHVAAAILLCAARLETQWFQPLFDHLLCFPNHRVRFWQPGRKPAPPFTPAFAYLGPDPKAFIREFRFGPVVKRVG